MMGRLGWAGVGVVVSIVGVVVACLAWLLPTVSSPAPAAPEADSGAPVPPTSAAVPAIGSAPLVTYLADLDVARDSDPYDDRGIAEINGVAYPHSQGAKFCASQRERRWTYVLGRKYDRFAGVVGLSDDSVAAARIRFEVSIDGRPAFSEELQVGGSAPVDLSVSGALRVELVTTLLTDEGSCASLATGQWADARVEASA